MLIPVLFDIQVVVQLKSIKQWMKLKDVALLSISLRKSEEFYRFIVLTFE